ncbi:MAG: flagellar hook-associated protein 3 [Armatimonadetes bacterium]|nr:MAG: flagellar hook-associated protein 3 [Armatimonadota bacterium]
MRIGTYQQYQSLQDLVVRAQERVMNLQRSLADGKRIRQPSDDPLGTLDILAFRTARAASQAHVKHAEVGVRNMKLSENSLNGIAEILKRAQVLVIQGANAPTTQDARQAMAAEIRTLRERLVGLANSQDGFGRYLFAGTAVTTEPFEVNGDPPTISYNGDDGKLLLEVGPGTTLEGNLLIQQEVTNAFNALVDAEQRLIGGDLTGLSGVTLQLVQDANAAINLLRGEVGQRQTQFASATEIATRRADDLTKAISEREDIDVTEAISNLQVAQAAYQASLASFSMVGRLSLLDFLR